MRNLAVVAVLLVSLGICLSGCDGEKIDTSKGGYGNVSTATTLPPQPNAQDVVKNRMANPAGDKGAPATPVAK